MIRNGSEFRCALVRSSDLPVDLLGSSCEINTAVKNGNGSSPSMMGKVPVGLPLLLLSFVS